jgi:NADH:ubiquinone oxidoreductase subunit 3 (subunit A)
MHNPYYNPYAHLKLHYYMIGIYLLNFNPQYIFLFKLAILIHKYIFYQIDDFIMHLWHLNKVHFVKSP